MTITNKYTPNGISIPQIKKYAKKLQKSSDLSYQQALDQVINEKTTYSSWNELKTFCDSQGGSIAKIKVREHEHVIFNDKNAIYFHYDIGMDGLNKNISFGIAANFKNIGIIEKRFEMTKNLHVFSDYIMTSSYSVNQNRQNLLDHIKNHDLIIINDIDSYSDFAFLENVMFECKKNKTVVFFVSFLISNGHNHKKIFNFVKKHTSTFIGDKAVKPIQNDSEYFDHSSELEKCNNIVLKTNYELYDYQKKALDDISKKSHPFIIDIGPAYKKLL